MNLFSSFLVGTEACQWPVLGRNLQRWRKKTFIFYRCIQIMSESPDRPVALVTVPIARFYDD
jgi:hypothetical protein